MNKIAWLLCLCLLLPLALCACGEGGAAGSMESSPSSSETAGISVIGVSARRGGHATVTVSVTGNPGLAGINLRLYYDEAALMPQSATGREGGLFVSNAEKGGGEEDGRHYVTLVWAAALPDAEDGTFFTVTFEVKENAPLGATQITPELIELQDGTQDLELPLSGGQILIVE